MLLVAWGSRWGARNGRIRGSEAFANRSQLWQGVAGGFDRIRSARRPRSRARFRFRSSPCQADRFATTDSAAGRKADSRRVNAEIAPLWTKSMISWLNSLQAITLCASPGASDQALPPFSIFQVVCRHHSRSHFSRKRLRYSISSLLPRCHPSEGKQRSGRRNGIRSQWARPAPKLRNQPLISPVEWTKKDFAKGVDEFVLK